MGLSIFVADLADTLEDTRRDDGLDAADIVDPRAPFVALNAFLRGRGIPEYEEPEAVPEIPNRGHSSSFRYSQIHAVRRIYAYLRAGLEPTPLHGDGASQDPVLLAEYARDANDSHLINHSDMDGFYVPIDFPDPLVASGLESVEGVAVGSSYRLRDELREIAPTLGISLKDGALPDSEAAAIVNDLGSHPYVVERWVWFGLFESANQSIELKAAIRFR
jgi:hypothetical protein